MSLGRRGSYRRQIDNSARTRLFQRRAKGTGRRVGLREARLRIEVRRDENKDSFDSLECCRERRGVPDIRAREVASALRPGGPFSHIAHYRPDRLLRRQKSARQFTAHIARYSGNCEHWYLRVFSHPGVNGKSQPNSVQLVRDRQAVSLELLASLPARRLLFAGVLGF